jgi:hypothetical protein
LKQIVKLGWISGNRGLIPLLLLTIPSSILSRLQRFVPIIIEIMNQFGKLELPNLAVPKDEFW